MDKTKVTIALLMVALMAALSLASATEMNESVMTTPEETGEMNVSVAMMSDDDGILSFPRENDTLFAESGYLIWEADFPIGNDYKISVGLVPIGMEVNSSNAIWVTVREDVSSDSMGSYYTWYPPQGISNDEEKVKYNAIVLIDHEAAGQKRGTYYQETFITEGPFFLIDPYDPLDDPPGSLSSPPSPPPQI